MERFKNLSAFKTLEEIEIEGKISSGESKTVEFKQTFAFDIKTKQKEVWFTTTSLTKGITTMWVGVGEGSAHPKVRTGRVGHGAHVHNFQ